MCQRLAIWTLIDPPQIAQTVDASAEQAIELFICRIIIICSGVPVSIPEAVDVYPPQLQDRWDVGSQTSDFCSVVRDHHVT